MLLDYEQAIVDGDLWQRPGLGGRDRSIVTMAILVARGQSDLLPGEFSRALDNGVTAAEISAIITHLAFYAGWGNAVMAARVAMPLYEARGITPEMTRVAGQRRLPLDLAAEDAREANVQQAHGNTAPGVVDYTRDVLFRDLWLRPELAPRDRSLVTVSALVGNGHSAQVGFHLNRAMDNGLSREQASEALTQMAFYAGWPNVFSAMSVFGEVFESRTP
ncbi:MAG: carboxymuconolactone decarboxylase family protein [Pseudomonadota bacterium]|nr:carboxymuconolactone decarboxylase family protein [Pseudomonadota bacterium]